MKSKKAAMEMSVGTLVTIVLLVGVLILGIYLIQKIFSGSSDAIDSINNEVVNQINDLFSNENSKISVAPPSREITLKKGDTPKGFAFSVRNNDVESASFSYEVKADDVSNCGSAMTKDKADSYLLAGTGTFSLGPGDQLPLPRLVKLDIPESAPPCTLIYNLNVESGNVPYATAQIFATIK